jgi:superfamily I DNA/RNA helicase
MVAAAVREQGEGRPALSELGLDVLVNLVGGQLAGQTSLLSAAEENEQRIDSLTRDQRSTLDRLRYHRRLRVIGGAGTGKTWLALEQARRLGRAGERVALVCYSRGLARWFERQTATWQRKERPAYVGLFHRLPVDWGAEEGADDDSDYWERRLPLRLGELALEQPDSERFDSVVVDEAQDFGELWWPALMACLRDPVKGGLYVFMDEAQRVFSRRGEAPIDIPPFVLDENIRNTKPIAQLFSSLTGEPAKPRGMTTPPVRLYDVPTEDVLLVVDDVVESLLDEGFAPGQIALLTTQHRHPEQRNAVEVGGWAAYWDSFFAEEDVFYGHVLGFKGLERPVVVLAVNGLKDPERAKEMLYVGLSRARTLLVIVGSRALLEEVGGGGVRSRLRSAQVLAAPG